MEFIRKNIQKNYKRNNDVAFAISSGSNGYSGGNIASISNKLDKSVWDESFYIDENGNLHCKKNFASDLGITAFASGYREVATIMDAIITDEETITKEDGVLKVIGGTGGSGGVTNWDDLEGKPTWITDSKPTYSWNEITEKPSTFTPSAHTHSISNITNLQSTLDGKANSSHTHTKSQITDFPTTWDWNNITNKPTSFTPSSHTHTISNITNLQSSLDSKLNSSSYTASDVLAKIKTVDGSGSGLDADTIDGYHESSFSQRNDFSFTTNTLVENWAKSNSATQRAGNIFSVSGWAWANDATLKLTDSISITKMRYSALSIRNGNLNAAWNQQAVMFIPTYSDSNMIYLAQICTNDTASNLSKKIIRYADYDTVLNSNVASATKLQTTRTIWGQNFNGQQNVSGNMTGVGSITASGNIVTQGGITCYSSDVRTKNIIEDINISLSDIANSPTVKFKWNNTKIKDDGKIHIGGIAQEIQKILPEAIVEENDILNVDYATTAYIYAVQIARHFQDTNYKLEKKIDELEKKIIQLEKQLEYEKTDTMVN